MDIKFWKKDNLTCFYVNKHWGSVRYDQDIVNSKGYKVQMIRSKDSSLFYNEEVIKSIRYRDYKIEYEDPDTSEKYPLSILFLIENNIKYLVIDKYGIGSFSSYV